MNAAIPSSVEIMKKVCSLDKRHKTVSKRNCKETCGDNTGYQFSVDYNESTNKFKPQVPENYYIDYTRRNKSHDLRLLNEIVNYFDFSQIPKHGFIGKLLIENFFNQKLKPMDTDFGSYEKISDKVDKIYNVETAATLLSQIITDPRFNNNNNELLKRKTIYGTLDIWTDLSRPFEFRM